MDRKPVLGCGYLRTQELDAKIICDYRVLPLYEKKIDKNVGIKRYSMKTNYKLASGWPAFKKTAITLKKEPFQLPKYSDFHFLNSKIVYDPSQSINNQVNRRFQMRAGPGFDYRGELPIPNDTRWRPKAPKYARKTAISKKM